MLSRLLKKSKSLFKTSPKPPFMLLIHPNKYYIRKMKKPETNTQQTKTKDEPSKTKNREHRNKDEQSLEEKIADIRNERRHLTISEMLTPSSITQINILEFLLRLESESKNSSNKKTSSYTNFLKKYKMRSYNWQFFTLFMDFFIIYLFFLIYYEIFKKVYYKEMEFLFDIETPDSVASIFVYNNINIFYFYKTLT
jgi:hypothetical protein